MHTVAHGLDPSKQENAEAGMDEAVTEAVEGVQRMHAAKRTCEAKILAALNGLERERVTALTLAANDVRVVCAAVGGTSGVEPRRLELRGAAS